MKTRIITMFAILAFVIPALVFGGFLIDALVAFILIVGTHEFTQLTEYKWPYGLEILMIILVLMTLLVGDALLLPYMAMLSILLFSMPVFTEKFKVSDAFLCIAFTCLFAVIGTSFLKMYAEEKMFIWFIILATYSCDSFAYLVGRSFGKHKLCERVSPKKTIEGSIGGWLLAMLISIAFAYFFIDEQHFMALAVASVFLPVFGQIGDLAFSAIKRHFKIKDFGNLLPGHGGVLDRVDSLLFNLVVFNLIYTMVNCL